MKRTQWLLFILSIVVLFAGCTVPDLSFAEKVTVQYVSGQDALSVDITDSEDARELVHVLTENTHSGSANCEFTQLQMLFEGDSKTIVLCPATDGCHNVFYSNNSDHYFFVSRENKKTMLDILFHYEIPLDYDYLYENMYER